MATSQKQLKDLAGTFLDQAPVIELGQRAKKRALGEVGEAFSEGAQEAATVAGAAGFAGAGGRTQDLIGDLTERTAEQKGATALGYDQALFDAIFGRQQAAAGILGNLSQLETEQQRFEETQPKWYDYLLGGAQAAAPIVGALAGGGAATGTP